MSNFNNIFDNKTKHEERFSIDLTVKSGYTIDYSDWIERPFRDEFDDYGTCLNAMIPWDLLKLTVSIDSFVLYQGAINIEGIQLHHDMLNSDITQQHSLTIAVAGFTSEHFLLHNGQEINTQVLISEFKIENLDLIPFVTKEGIKIFDKQSGWHPDYLQVLNFTTPIYPWLLSKFSDINHY
jgi:hypothetical protein